MPKSSFRVRTSFGMFFSIMTLADVNEGGTPYMGISPGRTHPCTHRPGVRFPKATMVASYVVTNRVQWDLPP